MRRIPLAPWLRLASLAAVLVVCVVAFALTGSLSSERVQSWFDDYGAAAPFVVIVVSALLTPALFPGPLLAGAAGLLFGTALGTPIAIVAATLGAVLAFAIGRWWAHDAVEELAGGRVARLREWIGRRGFYAILYARLAPAIPYNLVNYAAGLSPVRLGAFTAATAIGCAPRAFAYAALGGNLDDLTSPAAIAALVVLVLVGIGGWIALRRSGPGTATSSPASRSAAPP